MQFRCSSTSTASKSPVARAINESYSSASSQLRLFIHRYTNLLINVCNLWIKTACIPTCPALTCKPLLAQKSGFFLNLHNKFPGRRFKMKSLKDILAILVGLAAGIGAIFYFYKFVTDPNPAGGHTSGWIALGLAAVAFVCGLIYFLGHVNKEEEIHITQ